MDAIGARIAQDFQDSNKGWGVIVERYADTLIWPDLRTALLVLLTATALGLASCPITEPLEIPETRAAVRTNVFGADEYPQMLLRIGWAPVNADPLPSTPRRALSEVVARLDGSLA